MLPTLRRSALSCARSTTKQTPSTSPISVRTAATAMAAQKKAGDISDAFVSLSGQEFKPLPRRYAELKQRLIAGHEDAVQASWTRLLLALQKEIPLVAAAGPSVVPVIDFKDITNPPPAFSDEYRKRGVAVIRNVVPSQQALQWKDDIREYVRANPHTKAFPADNPQVFELYWSPSQLRARSHPNLLAAQKFLMGFWHSEDADALISTKHPTVYADRLRIRLPGDAKFALGPHVDGGSVERWEEEGYGRGEVYQKIWEGRWEEYDPWEMSSRVPVVADRYQGIGACSMFRMSQGWLSLSTTGPHEGTLLVNPLLKLATAYYLLRPFFNPLTHTSSSSPNPSSNSPDPYLSPSNWRLQNPQTSTLEGANPGHGQELSALLHPHLALDKSMVHVPQVQPGDYVSWHCDTIHAVDKQHQGASDSSVLYIPACPLTEVNAAFLKRQREAFVQVTPCPDFGGGEGEKGHVGRWGVEQVERIAGEEGMRAFGLRGWGDGDGLVGGERAVVGRSNEILGF